MINPLRLIIIKSAGQDDNCKIHELKSLLFLAEEDIYLQSVLLICT